MKRISYVRAMTEHAQELSREAIRYLEPGTRSLSLPEEENQLLTEVLYIELGVNTLYEEHRHHRHMHRYLLWQTEELWGFMEYDDESYTDYAELHIQIFCPPKNAGVKYEYDIGATERSSLELGEMIAQARCFSPRPTRRYDFIESIQDSLVDDLESENCCRKAQGVRVLNARAFSFNNSKLHEISVKTGVVSSLSKIPGILIKPENIAPCLT